MTLNHDSLEGDSNWIRHGGRVNTDEVSKGAEGNRRFSPDGRPMFISTLVTIVT